MLVGYFSSLILGKTVLGSGGVVRLEVSYVANVRGGKRKDRKAKKELREGGISGTYRINK